MERFASSHVLHVAHRASKGREETLPKQHLGEDVEVEDIIKGEFSQVEEHAWRFPPITHVHRVLSQLGKSSSVVHQMVVQQKGRCISLREEGATIRDGPDIDNSNVVGRLQHLQEVDFFEIVRLAGDEEVLPVNRLRIRVPGDNQTFGWVSECGRTREDSNVIVQIIFPLAA